MERKKQLIDANALMEGLKLHGAVVTGVRQDEVRGTIQRINESPTVDAVEVVRCKDCKHLEIDPGLRYDKRMCLMRGGEYGYCKDNDYCSYGERRTI